MRLGSDELRCLGGDTGHIGDNNLTPIRVGGARDSAIFFEVDSGPIKGISRSDWPPLGPGVGKVRRKGGEVWGDEGARDPCLPNSAPSYMVTIADRDSGTVS